MNTTLPDARPQTFKVNTTLHTWEVPPKWQHRHARLVPVDNAGTAIPGTNARAS